MGGEGGSSPGREVAVTWQDCGSCDLRPGGAGVAKGRGRPWAEGGPFLGGVTCGGRIVGSPLDLGWEGWPRAREAPPAEAPERAGEDSGVVLEPGARAAGLWRTPPAPGRLLLAGLCSALLRSGASLTDFLGASVGGLPGRTLGAVRGRPPSAPVGRDRRERAGDGAPGADPEDSGDKAQGGLICHFRAGPLPCPRNPVHPNSQTSTSCGTRGTRRATSDTFRGLPWGHRLLGWGSRPLLSKRAEPGNKRGQGSASAAPPNPGFRL